LAAVVGTLGFLPPARISFAPTLLRADFSSTIGTVDASVSCASQNRRTRDTSTVYNNVQGAKAFTKMNDPIDILIQILIFILAITVHEFAHAWSSLQLGDRTAYYQGRVTLQPAAHLDPVGTIMMVFSAISGYGIGWGKPVPVNPYNLRYGPRVGMAITAAAGPISNILQAIVWGIPLRLFIHNGLELPDLVFRVLWAGLWINLMLAFFNLIPLAPLDGFSIARGIFATIRARWAYNLTDFMDRIEPMAPMLFFMLIFLDQTMPGRGILGTLLMTPAEKLAGLILGVSF